jgi:hypothetical protein
MQRKETLKAFLLGKDPEQFPVFRPDETKIQKFFPLGHVTVSVA